MTSSKKKPLPKQLPLRLTKLLPEIDWIWAEDVPKDWDKDFEIYIEISGATSLWTPPPPTEIRVVEPRGTPWPAHKVWTLRKQFDFTQAQMAKHLSVDSMTLSRWELGKASPRWTDHLDRAAAEVGFDWYIAPIDAKLRVYRMLEPGHKKRRAIATDAYNRALAGLQPRPDAEILGNAR